MVMILCPGQWKMGQRAGGCARQAEKQTKNDIDHGLLSVTCIMSCFNNLIVIRSALDSQLLQLVTMAQSVQDLQSESEVCLWIF